ncbi:MAG TPA: bifunctional shikimate kinase/3-dehydroquinate synthase [Gaiellaceae bacterium]|nr:bifunctional shikimate kinase/3-dehydroquinate synthase [Gaiellaceae bacterium]
MALNALGRHIALIGFMGAGKSTLVHPLAERLGRPAVDVDDGATQIIEERGMDAFRVHELQRTLFFLEGREPGVFALGGGAVTAAEIRDELAKSAFTLLLDIDADTAWQRCGNGERPLAQDHADFRRLWHERQPLYREVADATADGIDGAILAAAGIHHELGALDRLGELVPGDGPVALVADATVMGIHGPRTQQALGDRLDSLHEVPAGEAAKQLHVVERLWSELRLDRGGTIVALGGGTTTDLVGYVASAYLRGVAWVPVPTTGVGQVDAAIGGKTGVDLPEGKNLVGAFHWPARTVIDPALLETLPERERRQGLAEHVKTELLAGHSLDRRAAAAYKAALCLRDPHDHGPRQWLNLGHTFAHALEAGAEFDLPHGEAVALGLLAALRLSGRDTAPVVDVLDPQPVAVDRERAWEALLRDKKRSGDAINLVLLRESGPVVEPRPADQVRAALDSLIR